MIFEGIMDFQLLVFHILRLIIQIVTVTLRRILPMGSSFSLEKQSQVIVSQLQKEYIVEDHPLSQNNPCIKTLFDRKTAKNYILRILPAHSSTESKSISELINLKLKNKSQSLTPLHTYNLQKVDFISGKSKDIYYLLFNLTNCVSLQSEIAKRSHESRFFSEDELMGGLNDIGKTLAWMRSVQNAGGQKAHANINSQSVYYCGQRGGGKFILGDPLIYPPPSGEFIEKYPSPERLMALRNLKVEQFDPFVSDLFSLALTMLQASTLGLSQRIYTKALINYDTLKLNLRRCPYSKLRETLTDLLLGSIEQRKDFLSQREPTIQMFSSRKIKLLSSQKSRSKSKSQRKIQLTTSRSKTRLNTSNSKIKMVTSQTCLTEISQNTQFPSLNTPKPKPHKLLKPQMITSQFISTPNVNFKYSSSQAQAVDPPIHSRNYFKEAQSRRAQRSPFDPYQIQRYIARINNRLSHLQSQISATIRQNSSSSMSVEQQSHSFIKDQSKSIHLAQTQKSEDYSMCSYAINIKQQDNSKIELPECHKNDEISQNESIFKESRIETELEKLKTQESDCIYQASYMINQSKITEGNVSSENGSFEIRDDPVEDSTSYVVNMKGTQLEVLSNLIIPEEAASQEESIHQGEEKGPEGQYVDQAFENGAHYKGYMLNGKRNGHGIHQYAEGGTYDGNWKDNRMSGYGKLFYSQNKLAYEGTWHEDSFHGRGKVYNDEPVEVTSTFNYSRYEEIQQFWVSYEGDFVFDSKQGYGKLLFSNGFQYHGQFQKDVPHGKGCIKNKKKEINGLWENGVLVKQL